MGFEEVKRRNEAWKQLMQSKINISFVNPKEDQDCMVVKLVPPYEGYDRLAKTFNGDYKEKPHYRMHILGDYNLLSEKPISNPRLELTIDDVRNLKDDDASILNAAFSAVQGIQREVSRGHSIFLIRRDGAAKNTKTTYTVLSPKQIEDDEWDNLLPKLSREDIDTLQKEESWKEISETKLIELQTRGLPNREAA